MKNGSYFEHQKTIILILLLCFLLSVIPSLHAEELQVYPDVIRQGEVLLLIDPENRYSGREDVFVLEKSDHTRVLSVTVFPYSYTRDSVTYEVTAALMGIPNTLSPGSYRIFGRGLSKEIIIEKNEFREESISLNQTLSELRTSPDPRIVEEAMQIQKIYSTTRREALYHTGAFLLPLQPVRKSALYGDRRIFLYADGTSARSIHSGIDYAAPAGTPVRAGGSGRVVLTGDRIVTGKTVVIEHLPGVYGVFFHLDSIDVKESEIVIPEQQIGTVGMTGLATGPHLHWEIRVSGYPVNPEIFLESALLDKDRIIGIVEKNTSD